MNRSRLRIQVTGANQFSVQQCTDALPSDHKIELFSMALEVSVPESDQNKILQPEKNFNFKYMPHSYR